MFSCQPSFAATYQKGLKRFFLTLKQSDQVDSNGRSVFYCILLKILIGITKLDDQEVLRMLSTTMDGVRSLPEVKDQQMDIEIIDIGRLVLGQRLLKLVKSAIILIVNTATKSKEVDKKQVKSEQENAYIKLIEDLFSFAIRDPSTIFMTQLIPSLMSTAFVNLKYQAKIKAKILDFVSSLRAKFDGG